MNQKLKNRFTVIGLVLFFSVLFVWPPFDDPPLVSRTVERLVGAEGRLEGKVIDRKTGKPLVRQVDILGQDDDHTTQVHSKRWYAWFVRRRFDATPQDRIVKALAAAEGKDQEFKLPEGGSRTVKVKTIEFRQDLLVRHTLNLGLDLSGGVELVYQVKPVKYDEEGDEATSSIALRQQVAQLTEAIVDIIKKRIDISGLKEPRIQAQGNDRVLIQIPGKDQQDVDNIKKIIQRSGRLEFRLVCSNKEILREAERGVEFDDYKWFEMAKEDERVERLLIKIRDPYNVTGADLASAYPTQDQTGLPAVGFKFKPGKGRKFGWMTQENTGERVAIILDGRVFSAPVVEERIDNVGIIRGGAAGFTYQEAKNLATVLSAGSLPADLELEMESDVSPFIGDDSIRGGLMAIAIGGALVFLVIAIYYLGAGGIADLALAFNILILLGCLAMFHATLTLPGIAGILLTIGMAVDANVLVFERIREERGRRDNLFKALEAGYDRAFLTIFDANATTIITALILVYIGTGPVRGFGITLAIGILASLFTAIYVTRTIFSYLLEKNFIQEIRMMRLPFLRDSNIPFLRFGRPAMAGSVLVLLAGLVFLFLRGQNNLDIDFKGGYLVHIKLKEAHQTEEIRKLINEKADLRKPEVQKYGEGTDSGSTDFVIRTDRDYSYTYGANDAGMPKKNDAGLYVATLYFAEKIDPDLVRERLNAHDSFSEVRVVPQEDNSLEITLKSKQDSEDEVRRSIAGELQSLPKYDLLRVPELRQILLPDPFADEDDSLLVNLISPFSAEELENELKKHDFQELAVNGLEGQDGTYTRFEIKVEEGRYGELKSLLRGLKELQLSEPFPRYTKIGKAVASDLVWKALVALVLSWVAILIYVGTRFHGIKYGAAAIIALIHDALFTLIVLSIFDSLGLVDGKINLTMIAALLTIVGYSVNDTIVIFDRVRENVQNSNRPSAEFPELVNRSNNQMLARTLLTSGSSLIALFSLFIFGGGVIHGFAFAMIIGVVVGTYSSIFIACPIVVEWDRLFGGKAQS